MVDKTGDDGAVDPLQVLLDDLMGEDFQTAVESAKRIKVIALALGTERTKQQLIPELDRYCFPVGLAVNQTQDSYANVKALSVKEEILTEIARELDESFVELAGGASVASQRVLPLLQKLAQVEETVVREAAVKSLASIFKHLTAEQMSENAFPLIQHLSQGEWFSSRISALGLYTDAYRNLKHDPTKLQELRAVFKLHCADEMPMVRKKSFETVADIVKVVPKEEVMTDFWPLVDQLGTDNQDNIRQLLVDISISLMTVLDPDTVMGRVIPVLKNCALDKSWRVRQHFAEKFPAVIEPSESKLACEQLLPLYGNLLIDKETEVKKAAIENLAESCKSVDSHTLEKVILKKLTEVAKDQNEDVKISLAEAVAPLAEFCGKDVSERVLLPTINKLFGDNSARVKSRLMDGLDRTVKVIGVQNFVKTLLPRLIEMSNDSKWRVRLSVINKLSDLAPIVDSSVFEQNLLPLIQSSFADNVFQVRAATCLQADLLAERFSVDWAVEHLFDKALSLHSSLNYLHRMVPLLLIQALAPRLSHAENSEHFLQPVLRALDDPIVNVRFAASKTLTKLVVNLDSDTVQTQIVPKLKAMESDPDIDAQFFASETLKLC